MDTVTTKKTGLEAVTSVRQALADAGMPRTSKLAGGEMTGWTRAIGSTGFSVHQKDDGTLMWHVVVSGKPLLPYRQTAEGHEPVHPERLCQRVKEVFRKVGLEVLDVYDSGYQMAWDDDVTYTITTTHPDWLEDAPRLKPFGGLRCR